jgi:hypothetical protein
MYILCRQLIQRVASNPGEKIKIRVKREQRIIVMQVNPTTMLVGLRRKKRKKNVPVICANMNI